MLYSRASTNSTEMRYAWSVPELGMKIPLHPLIAEARRHAARGPVLGHVSDMSLGWPSTLGRKDVSGLRCAEEDRVTLGKYLDYLKMCNERL